MSRHCFGEAKQKLEWITLRKHTKVCIGTLEYIISTHVYSSFSDLLKVLNIEPNNQSAQEELKKVASLIEKEKSKVSSHLAI